MKIFTRILLTTLAVTLNTLVFNKASAQCGGGNNNSTVSFACNSELSQNPQNTGDYRMFNVVSGVNYNFNTIGISFDDVMYGKQGGVGGTQKFAVDNNISGGGETIDWTADFTGSFGVAVHNWYCGWTGTSALLRYKQNTTIANNTDNSAICMGQTKTLSYSLGGTHNNPAVTWSITGGTGSGSISGNTFTPSAAGTITVAATVGVCTSSGITFTVYSQSTAPTGISGTTTICSGSSTTLTATGGTEGTGVNSGAGYQWYAGGCASGGVIGTGSSITVSPTSTTTYFVRRSGTCNTTGCTQVTVTVNQPSTAPTGVTVGTPTICQGSSSTLTLVGGSLGTGASWQWYSGSCGGSSAGSGTSITPSPGSTTTYFVAAVGTCNTTSCAQGTVNVNPTPGATISGTTTVCQNASPPNITITNSAAQPVTVSYTVNGSPATVGISASSFANISAPTGTAGTFTYTLTSIQYQSAPVCATSISGSATVTVRPTPTASISGTTTVCQGSGAPNITFTNPQALPVTVTYNIDGGSNQTIGVNANSTATVAAPTGTAGTFVYNLVNVAYQSGATCTNSISGSATVTVRPTPAASISGTTTVCQDAAAPNITFTNLVALPVTVTYQINSGSNQTITVPGSSTATVSVPTATAGTYAYSLVSVAYTTTPSCSVSLSGTATVTVRPTPAATISGTTTLCQGATAPTITFTNPNALAETITYTINGNPFTINVNGNSSATVTAPTGTVGTFTYALVSVVYQSAPTCVTTLTGAAIVTVNPLPVLQETHTNLSCLNSGDGVITLSVTPPGTTAPYIYSITGGSSFQGANNGTFTGLSAGTYNTLVVQDANGCRNTNVVSVTLTQPTQLNISLSSSTDASCNGVFDGELTVAGSGGTPTYQYSLSGGPYQPSGTFTNLAAGSYVVTVKDAEDCQNTINVTINNSYTVTATISSPVNVSCPGLQDGGYTINASGGVTPYNYANNGLLFGTNNVFTGLPIGTYTGFVRDSRGCLASDQVTITTLAAPTAIITGTASFCAGGSTQLFATSSTPGAGGFQGFQWQLNGSNIGGATSAVYTASAAGNYTVVVTNTNNCSTTSAVTTVTVNPLPTITVNPFTTAICNGSSIALTASGASTYTWSPATGLSATTGTTVTANPTSTQTYTITGTDVNGCVNSTTKTVTVNNLPTVSVSPTAPTICNGGSVQLTASGANSYSWAPSTGLLSTSGTTVTAQPTSTQTYTVTGTDLNNCSSTANVTVSVTNNPVVTITSNPNPATICLGQPITLTSNFASGNTWSTGATTQSITVTPSQVGGTTYTLFSTQSGCQGSATKTVTVNPVPFAVINPSPTASICSGNSVTLSAVTDIGTNYLWSNAATTQSISATSAGNYTVTITNSATGCSTTSAATTVSINSAPAASITASPISGTICAPGTVTLTANSGMSSYAWSNGLV
ncbi:MAG: beta strand repeat-containing protein, partial [Bacteroidia bacterium]